MLAIACLDQRGTNPAVYHAPAAGDRIAPRPVPAGAAVADLPRTAICYNGWFRVFPATAA
ncbi:MAG: hypothetical protein KF688_05010 [Pirellulales bacterium]|nr:hypothetical protein [Pirellulales bacterium]